MSIRRNILDNLAINYNYSYYLYITSPSKITNFHWGHFRYMAYKMLVIEACKLFTNNNNQKYNFYKLFEKLGTGEFRQLYVGNSKIENWKNDINLHSDFIIGLKYLRDNLFAHTDKVQGSSPLKQFFTKMKILINLGYHIQNELFLHISENQVRNLLDKTDFLISKFSQK